MKRLAKLFSVMLALIFIMGEDSCPPRNPPPPAGFQIHTRDQDNIFLATEDSPNIDTEGTYQHDLGYQASNGFIGYFRATTDGNGLYEIPNGRAPAVWLFKEYNGPCAGQSTTAIPPWQGTQTLDCIVITTLFSVTPDSLDVVSPPASIQVSGGSGIDPTYGMPHIQIYDSVGDVVAESVASSVSGDGSGLEAPTPNIYGLQTTTYGVKVLNIASDGSLTPVGAGKVDMYDSTPPDLCTINRLYC
jgi:hypothetical protein